MFMQNKNQTCKEEVNMHNYKRKHKFKVITDDETEIIEADEVRSNGSAIEFIVGVNWAKEVIAIRPATCIVNMLTKPYVEE